MSSKAMAPVLTVSGRGRGRSRTVGWDCSTAAIARASPSDRTTFLNERCTSRRRCSSNWL